jgi:hypothetical protein
LGEKPPFPCFTDVRFRPQADTAAKGPTKPKIDPGWRIGFIAAVNMLRCYARFELK